MPASSAQGGNKKMGGNVIRRRVRAWERHARVSSETAETGRGTSEGQSALSGQRSENQPITSSYLRAVNVVAPASKRSKKRQSPAAKRPIVVKLRSRADAYADAQAMRFDRSSVSMGDEHSRSFPTTQAEKVGNIQLAESFDLSDKSAMATAKEVDRIRHRIQKALDKAELSPFTLARELGWDRHHLAEYLNGKKDSLKVEKLIQLSGRLGIPFNELIPGGLKEETG